MPNPILSQNSSDTTSMPAPTTPSWIPPNAWKLQVFCADGSVIAEVSRAPHAPLVIHGSPEAIALVADQIESACRFFKPAPPHFVHGPN